MNKMEKKIEKILLDKKKENNSFLPTQILVTRHDNILR